MRKWAKERAIRMLGPRGEDIEEEEGARSWRVRVTDQGQIPKWKRKQ